MQGAAPGGRRDAGSCASILRAGLPSLDIQAANGVADREQGMVSGLLNTSGQVGGAIFLAVVTAVATAGAPADPTPQAVLESYRPGLAVVTVIAAAGLLITLPGLRTRRSPG